MDDDQEPDQARRAFIAALCAVPVGGGVIGLFVKAARKHPIAAMEGAQITRSVAQHEVERHFPTSDVVDAMSGRREDGDGGR